MKKTKRAFTLIELIFVIVLIGILATFGTDIYTNVYKNYIYARSINELETRTELALEQIAARLGDRIHSATIARREDNATTFVEYTDNTYTILEWIGQSVESKNLADVRPGWSGYIDVDASMAATAASADGFGKIITPGSSLAGIDGENSSFASTVIKNLGVSVNNLALIFVGDSVDSGNGFGFNGAATNVMRVNLTNANPEIMNVNNTIEYNGDISERYYLAHSAYALVPEAPVRYTDKAGRVFSDFTLNLHYNYQPWNGQAYNNATTLKVPIAENVTLFRFRGNFGGIDLKLCMRDPKFENAGFGADFIVCKSKVVF